MSLASIRTRLTTLPRVRRELLIFALALACGVLVVPLLIWGAGRAVLGPYTHGGPQALLRDFASGLATGSLPYWAVAFGPYAIVLLARLIGRLARRPVSEAPDRDALTARGSRGHGRA